MTVARLGLVCLTPRAFGGAESALQGAAVGLRALGHEVTVVAMSVKGGTDWSDQCSKFIDRGIDWRKESVEDVLSKFDGLILSDTHFGDERLAGVLTTSDKIAPWVSARHWNSLSKTVTERHERTKAAPKWCGKYVSFWPSVEIGFEDVGWERGVLPYTPKQELHHLTPVIDRPVDFGYVGRTDPGKGVMGFVSALEACCRYHVHTVPRCDSWHSDRAPRRTAHSCCS